VLIAQRQFVIAVFEHLIASGGQRPLLLVTAAPLFIPDAAICAAVGNRLVGCGSLVQAVSSSRAGFDFLRDLLGLAFLRRALFSGWSWHRSPLLRGVFAVYRGYGEQPHGLGWGSFDREVRLLSAAACLPRGRAFSAGHLLLPPNVADISKPLCPTTTGTANLSRPDLSMVNAAVEEGAYRGVIGTRWIRHSAGFAALLLQALALGRSI